jgi:hypothetical protein
MNPKLLLIVSALLVSLATPRAGAAENGVVTFEVPFATTLYIECLGEEVGFELVAIVRTHLIELLNGRVHYVENWFLEGSALGLDSGHTWFAHGPSPFVANVGAAQANNTLLANLVFEPLDGGQKFREKLQFRLVVDANGVVHLDRGSQQFLCVGD